MPLAPIRQDANSAMMTLRFSKNEITLNNIERYRLEKEVIHEVQTTKDTISPYVTHTDLGDGTSSWQTITYKRDPQPQNANISTFNPRPQQFDQFGKFANKYADSCWLTDAIQVKSFLNVRKAVIVEMLNGFTRLETKLSFGAMVNPVRWRKTKYSVAEASGVNVELDTNRIGAVMIDDPTKVVGGASKAQNGVGLALPDLNFFTALQRRFTNNNVDPSMVPCIACTPNLMDILTRISEFKNRLNIYTGKADWDRDGMFEWKGFKFIKCTPEVSISDFYAGKIIEKSKVPAGKVSLVDSAPSGTSATGNYMIKTGEHEVLPVWFKSNIYKVTDKRMDVMKLLRVPYFQLAPVLFKHGHGGGSRAQNMLQYNVVVPLVS